MEAVAGSAAYGEAIVFLGCFRDFPDPRQRGKVIYPLEEVLLLCLLAVLAGAETFVDIARFGQKKIAFLRRFLPFRDGTPSHDHLGDIFATLDATEFQRRFVAWVAKLIGVSADVIELCWRLGDEVDQAAWWAGISMTSMPFWNLIPWTIFGNWFSPFNRRHVFAAALTSLNTMSLAVFADRAPFVRTVR